MKLDHHEISRQGQAAAAAAIRAKHLRDLEKEAKRIHVGSYELGNELNVRADVYSEPSSWKYIVKVEYTLNGDTRRTHKKVDMSEMSGPQDMKDLIRSLVVESVADKISAEVIRQNLKVVSSAGGDYPG